MFSNTAIDYSTNLQLENYSRLLRVFQTETIRKNQVKTFCRPDAVLLPNQQHQSYQQQQCT